jgi:hypothetical protein
MNGAKFFFELACTRISCAYCHYWHSGSNSSPLWVEFSVVLTFNPPDMVVFAIIARRDNLRSRKCTNSEVCIEPAKVVTSRLPEKRD